MRIIQLSRMNININNISTNLFYKGKSRLFRTKWRKIYIYDSKCIYILNPLELQENFNKFPHKSKKYLFLPPKENYPSQPQQELPPNSKQTITKPASPFKNKSVTYNNLTFRLINTCSFQRHETTPTHRADTRTDRTQK